MATSDLSTSLTDDLFVDQNGASTDQKISFSVQESVGALEMLKNEMQEREITLGELFREVAIDADSITREDLARYRQLKRNASRLKPARYIATIDHLGYWPTFKNAAKKRNVSLRCLMETTVLKRSNLLP